MVFNFTLKSIQSTGTWTYKLWFSKNSKRIIFQVEFIYSLSISSLDDWKLLDNYRKKNILPLPLLTATSSRYIIPCWRLLIITFLDTFLPITIWFFVVLRHKLMYLLVLYFVDVYLHSLTIIFFKYIWL